MMKINILIASIIISTNTLSLAQTKFHEVKLSPEPISTEVNFYVKTVIDNRQFRESLGIAQKGLSNRQIPAIFPEKFEPYLQKNLNIIIPISEEKKSVIVRINKLFISEQTSMWSELGRCEIQLEFLKEDGLNIYSYGIFSATVEDKSAEVTNKHDERIIEALEDCIMQFHKSSIINSNVKLALTTIEKREYNIDFSETLKEGLYSDFGDLAENSPMDSVDYKVELIGKATDFPHYKVIDDATGKKIKNLFGFYDNGIIYINASRYTTNEYFIPSLSIGQYIYFEDLVYNSTMDVGYMFGAIGGLIVSSSTESGKTGIILDTKTGLTSVLTKTKMEEILWNQQILLTEYRQGKKKLEDVKSIIIKLNENLANIQ